MEAKDIKKLRKKLKMTQTEFADKLGVAKLTVFNWEHGLFKPSQLALRQLHRLERKS